MPLRLRPLPSPARLRGRGSDWLVAIYLSPCPGLAWPRPKLTASAVCLPLLAGGQHSQKDSLEHCQAQRVPFLCPVGEEGQQSGLPVLATSPCNSSPSYHTALQSHKQPENVIRPLKDPEDTKISEYAFYPRLLAQGKTDHMPLLSYACLLLPAQLWLPLAENHPVPS